MKCEYCKKDITDQWERHVTYKGEEEHHNPPKFMMEKWSGNLINLCVDCHDELHKQIIKILNEVQGSLKFCNSEFWVWNRMTLQQRDDARKKVIEFTNDWIGGEDDGKSNP